MEMTPSEKAAGLFTEQAPEKKTTPSTPSDLDEGQTNHGKWSVFDVPHKGWICVGVDDLEESIETCEMCESQAIRFIHYMQHSNYSGTLACGCVCAGRMENDYPAKARESLHKRRERWRSARWNISYSGNPYLNANGSNVVVFPSKKSGWAFRVEHRETGDAIFSRKLLATEDAAKARSFDAILWMKERWGCL
jgi:hypothetical protein